MIAAVVRLGRERCLKLVGKYGMRTVLGAAYYWMDYSEQRLRAEIAKIPDGDYHAESWLDDDGRNWDVPLRVNVNVKVRGSDIVIDLTGSSAEVETGYNVPFEGALLVACYYYIVRTLLLDDATIEEFIPQNEGMFRPVSAVAPRGSIFNPNFPRACFARMAQVQRVLDCVIRALAPVMPERVTAGNSATVMSISYSGFDPRRQQYWVCVEVNEGSYGARSAKDGLDSVDNLMANTRNVPIEEIETRFPLRIERYELRPDPPGAGEWRGGIGVVREVRMLAGGYLSCNGDRHLEAPRGLFGGGDGLAGRLTLNPGQPDEEAMPFQGLGPQARSGRRGALYRGVERGLRRPPHEGAPAACLPTGSTATSIRQPPGTCTGSSFARRTVPSTSQRRPGCGPCLPTDRLEYHHAGGCPRFRGTGVCATQHRPRETTVPKYENHEFGAANVGNSEPQLSHFRVSIWCLCPMNSPVAQSSSRTSAGAQMLRAGASETRAPHPRRRLERRNRRSRVPRAYCGARTHCRRMGVSGSRHGSGAGEGAGPRTVPGRSARGAVRHQGRHRHRGSADRLRLADLPGSPSSPRRRLRRAPQGCRRADPRQDGDGGVCVRPSRRHPPPARPRPHARRLVQRLGRGGRGRHGAGGARNADRRFHHPSRGLLRHRRVQARPRLDPRRRAEAGSLRRSTPSASWPASWRTFPSSPECWRPARSIPCATGRRDSRWFGRPGGPTPKPRLVRWSRKPWKRRVRQGRGRGRWSSRPKPPCSTRPTRW